MKWGKFEEGDVDLDAIPIFKHLKDYKDEIINEDPATLSDRDRELWRRVAQLVRTDKTMEYVHLLQDMWKGSISLPVAPKVSPPPKGRGRVPKQCFYCDGRHIVFRRGVFICGNGKCATVLEEEMFHEVDAVERCGGVVASSSTRDILVSEFRRAERNFDFNIYQIQCMEQLVDHLLQTYSESFVRRNQQSIKLASRVFTDLVVWARHNMTLIRGVPSYQQVAIPKEPERKPLKRFDYEEFAHKEWERIRALAKKAKLG